jgi:predicted RND superfamily exporter protein
MHAHVYAPNTISALQDMMLIIISILVFMAVAIAFFTCFDRVRTRTTLALLGIVVVALGIVSGWAWGMIFGMPFTPLQRETPRGAMLCA